MTGLELAESFFFDHGLPVLESEFPELTPRLAAGLISCGSEVFGWDDEISQDHNWGGRFLLFLTESDFEQHGATIQETLGRELPREYRGVRMRLVGEMPITPATVVPAVGACEYNTGFRTPPSDRDWLSIREHQLFEFTAGKIFYEPQPLITPLREAFAYFPENVWRKRLSFAWFMASHCANVARVAKRGDVLATHAYLAWGVEICARLLHLLNRQYAPFRKWLFHSTRLLPNVSAGVMADMQHAVTCANADEAQESLLRAFDAIATKAIDMKLIPPQPLRANREDLMLPFDFEGFMKAFADTVEGELRDIHPHQGPADMHGSIFWFPR